MSAVNKADAERIALLRVTSLVQGGPHPACEALVRLAARHTGAPVAAINLVDEHSVTALAHVGEVHRQHGRQVSLCGWVVDHRCELVVADMLDDDRLADRLGGLPAPTKTAYLGYPIIVEGQALGTVCVLDQGPRQWRDDDLASLREHTDHIVALKPGDVVDLQAREYGLTDSQA